MATDMPEQEEAPHVELVGYDRQGANFATALPAGKDPTQIEEWIRSEGGRVSFARVSRPDRPRPAGVSAEDFARFNEMLAAAVRRGVPLLDGVRDLALDFKQGKFHTALERVAGGLQRGAGLREAFAPESSGFPQLYGHLIEAGAASGNLPEVLLRLSRNIRTDTAFRRGIVEACVYPMLLLVVCFALLSGFATYIMPTYDLVARLLHMRIPTITRILTGQTPGSRLAMQLGGAVVILLILLWFTRLRRTATGQRIKEEVLRRVPYFRSFYEAAVWSGAADTLALLVRAQVPAPAGLRLVGPATGTHWLAQACDRLALEAEKGKPLSTAAREYPEIPYRVAQALDTGEARNDMATALTELAERYRYDSERQARLLAQYLPPALAVVMGVLVFTMALTMLWPYFGLWGAEW